MTDIEKKIRFLNRVFQGKTFFRGNDYCTIEKVEVFNEICIKVLFVGSDGYNHACTIFRGKLVNYFGMDPNHILMLWCGYVSKEQIETGF